MLSKYISPRKIQMTTCLLPMSLRDIVSKSKIYVQVHEDDYRKYECEHKKEKRKLNGKEQVPITNATKGKKKTKDNRAS